MSGPRQDLAETLLAKLSADERDFLDRWSTPLSADAPRSRDWIEGFFAGKFLAEGYSMVALSNAARAIRDGEVAL